MEIRVGEQRVDLSSPVVMAIVNVTPDSFFAGSRRRSEDEILRYVESALSEGATILDVGGYSSRPGADDVDSEEEWRRVSVGLRVIRNHFPQAVVSIDTFRASVAQKAVSEFGPCIINDISAGDLDAQIVEVVAKNDLPYVAMHMRGCPQDMQQYAEYDDIVLDVRHFFEQKLRWLCSCDVRQPIIDPGFGFAKDLGQNYRLLAGLDQLCAMGYPVLAGLSRKSMVYKLLDVTPDDALTGTTALHWECLRQGASILRVHDVHEAVQTVRIFEYYQSVNK